MITLLIVLVCTLGVGGALWWHRREEKSEPSPTTPRPTLPMRLEVPRTTPHYPVPGVPVRFTQSPRGTHVEPALQRKHHHEDDDDGLSLGTFMSAISLDTGPSWGGDDDFSGGGGSFDGGGASGDF